MVLLRYGSHPYSTVFCTAVAVYSTVVSPNVVDSMLSDEGIMVSHQPGTRIDSPGPQ